MMSPDRIQDALANLFSELADCHAWQQDLMSEAARARRRQEGLVTSIRACIETLGPPDRTPHLDRLREITGLDPVCPAARGRPTARTRFILNWLTVRDPAEFHVADLRTAFQGAGHHQSTNYLPTLLMRFKRRGIVEAAGFGRYRVCREHPELVG